MNQYIPKKLIHLRLTSQEVSTEELGSATIYDQKKMFQDMRENALIKEFLLLQKCNCVELYFVVDSNLPDAKDFLLELWVKYAKSLTKDLQSKIIVVEDFDAAKHLIQVATSLESLLIGDAQVLGQLRKARIAARQEKTLGPVLNLLLKYANIAGSRTRTETNLCTGNVSVPRVVYDMATDLYSKEKGNILVIGAGKMGKLIADLLAEKLPKKHLFISNRTKEKAEILAKKLQINVEDFLTYKNSLKKFRYIIYTVNTDRYLITEEEAKTYLDNQKTTFIDICNPACVDPKLTNNKNYSLLNLNYIQGIGAKNLNKRKLEAEKAQKIAEEELKKFKNEVKILGVEGLIADLFEHAYAQSMQYVNNIHKGNKSDISDIDNLVRGIIARTLTPVAHIRTLARKDFATAKNLILSLKQIQAENTIKIPANKSAEAYRSI